MPYLAVALYSLDTHPYMRCRQTILKHCTKAELLRKEHSETVTAFDYCN